MARKSKIRWRDSDTQELQRLINNFNNKIYRTKKAHPEMEDFLPSRVSKKDLVNSIETRADFKRIANSLARFSKRGAEAPVVSTRGARATQWEIDEFKRKQQIENARRTRERKALEEKEVKIAGKGTGQTRAQMGSVKENELKPSRKNFQNMSQKEWELASKNIDNQLNATKRHERMEQMRENYLKGLTEAGFADASPELVEIIKKIDIQTFYDTVQTDETATFSFIYDPLAFNVKKDALFEAWKTAYEGNK